MKSPDQILHAVGKRVAATWHLDIAGESDAWPHHFTLGTLSKPELEAGFAATVHQILEWHDWADKRGLTLITSRRRVHGTTQSLPTHVAVPDLDTAVALLGPEWKKRIQQGRCRLTTLRSAFPGTAEYSRIVRAVDNYSDVDFDLLCTAASWFTSNTASGLTPRQVPIEGLHAKWLNTHRHLVQALAGLESLQLLPEHPQRIHFTYLDPDHLVSGKRRHDSATVGDAMTPAYLPEVVLISENKDTAIHFPTLNGGISVEGTGFAGARAISSFAWLASAHHIVYWGDMDADGFEIVNQFRQRGLPIISIFMDLTAFETYERFGTMTDARGNALRASHRKDLIHLTDHERELYRLLTDPTWTRVRRIEQERIPLTAAWGAVQKLINTA
ncbi:Wadjet anti-phage system protein JetD domain-containing protein [Nonomuraea sp. NPDC046802]|uniref:Wadjet anti-phage system protein JetD domain-containing protein n=1 Tax=Nonomuraea sp. NPDC046802 TaxID=3154919 RepID=UPI0033D82B32